jgi:hypothetical protein
MAEGLSVLLDIVTPAAQGEPWNIDAGRAFCQASLTIDTGIHHLLKFRGVEHFRIQGA